MKIFLDTNIFLRLLIPKDKHSAEECHTVINNVESGTIEGFTSTIVISELIYVLLKLYKIEKYQVLEWINDVLKMNNLSIIESTNLKKAVQYYKEYNIKFGDCLIATQVPQGVSLCTYDSDFKKIKDLTTILPNQVR